VVSFTTRPLYPSYPLDRRLDGPQSRSGRGGEGISSQILPGVEPGQIFIVAMETRRVERCYKGKGEFVPVIN
jgi:hypothetical protein